MATSTLYQSSSLGSPAGSPRSCLYLPRQQTFQPKADWRASFTNTNRDSYKNQVPHTRPIILRQHDGVWLTSFSDNSIPKKDSIPQPPPQPETPPAPPKATEDSVTSPSKSRLTLGRVPKTLRCHVCQANIREQNFQNHLFFGAVRCNLCDLSCNDCRSFERQKDDAELGYSSCTHSFSYTEDPYEYLLPRLSGSDDMDVGGSLTLPNKLRVLQHYVNQLTSLQLREPWCTAVRKCKSRLLKTHSPTQLELSEDLGSRKDSSVTGEGSLGVEEGAHVSPAPVSESDGRDGSLKVTPGLLTCPSSARQGSQEEQDEDAGVLLTQSYDLEHLEQAVEYVEVEEQCRLADVQGQPPLQSKSKKRRKTTHYKKLKGHRLTLPQRRKKPPMVPESAEEVDKDETDLVMEEVALPENGYYLMVREAVEECPMCYESLSPSRCSVNMRTFLFTVSCSECGLLIYIVPDLPDGLKIVTDSGGGEMITLSKENKQYKTSRKIRPQDFFAR